MEFPLHSRPMMGYRHSREDMLHAAIEVAAEDGLGSLTFGRVAKKLGTSDRMVVYYFPTKSDLINQVAAALGGQLQELLAKAFGSDPLPAADLARRAWPVLAATSAEAVFAAFFEVVGLASAGREPFVTMAPMLIDSWVDWLVPRIAADDVQDPRDGALALVAQIDGLLLLRQVKGVRAANKAARQLGIA